jgi:hypothetical protein
VENIPFLSVNSKKNAKKFEKSAKFSNPQNWGKKKEKKEEEKNPSECMRIWLAKSSQKATLKIKIAEMKCYLRFSIAKTWQKNYLYVVQVGIAKKYRRMFYKF